MDLTVFEKIASIFKYTFSSFLSIELLIFTILLFIVLIVNTKVEKKIVTYSVILIYVGLLLGTLLAYSEYVVLCVEAFLKIIVEYICFPTTVAFFFTMVFITGVMIYTLFTTKLRNFKKIVNYLFFCILYFLFMNFIILTAYYRIDLSSNVSLYSNDTILSIVQGSNVLLLIWFIFTFFYKLYLFYEKRFDK